MLTGHNAVGGRLDLRRAVGTLCIACLTLLPGCAQRPSAPPPTGRIAFVSSREPAGVYVMNADGSDLTFLGGNPLPVPAPRWSPDGTKIAITSRMIGNVFKIEVFDADGSNHVILQKGSNPVWSPDGAHIAYVSYPEQNAEIYTMHADGSGRMRLTTSPANDWNPEWSPDGLQIAFTSVEGSPPVEDEKSAIYIINADGTGLRRLWQGYGDPVWSPDGQRIAFIAHGLHVMGKDGSDEMMLADNAQGGYKPAWSPDGTRIAFACLENSLLPDICIVDADGQNLRRLTGNFPSGSNEFEPAWSPDGEWIAFCASKPHFDIHIMTSDGSSQTNLTNDQASDLAPAWMP